MVGGPGLGLETVTLCQDCWKVPSNNNDQLNQFNQPGFNLLPGQLGRPPSTTTRGEGDLLSSVFSGLQGPDYQNFFPCIGGLCVVEAASQRL